MPHTTVGKISLSLSNSLVREDHPAKRVLPGNDGKEEARKFGEINLRRVIKIIIMMCDQTAKPALDFLIGSQIKSATPDSRF